MPFDRDFRDAEIPPIRRNETGRPRVNPDAPLTGAERAKRHREKHGERINRTRRQRRKVAAILAGTLPASVAHQRIIRDQHTAVDPTEIAASLSRYTVEIIDRAIAAPFIRRHEWLGTLGRPKHCVGLFSPSRDIHGVAAFGHGPTGPIRDRIGEPSLCLERGACAHTAPRNAASFLITQACRLLWRITGTAIFFAYADPCAGEYGGVYQACGWVYLGQGLRGEGEYRTHRNAVLPPGCDPDDPAQWRTTRDLRRHGRNLTFAEAVEQGWRIGTRPAKHVYAVNVGRDRKAWRRAQPTLEYPKPRPELTMAARALRSLQKSKVTISGA
jgi:hypothetical protein